MASVSRSYLNKKENITRDGKNTGSAEFEALVYGTTIDLTALLKLTEKGFDRLPIVYRVEATA